MSFVEWVGFVASLIGVVFLFTRDAVAKRQKEKDPEKYAEKQRRMREALRQMGLEVEPEQEDEEEEEDEVVMVKKEVQPPLPAVKPRAATAPTPTKVKPAQVFSAQSRVADMVKKLPDRRGLLVAHILFGPPKSLE